MLILSYYRNEQKVTVYKVSLSKFVKFTVLHYMGILYVEKKVRSFPKTRSFMTHGTLFARYSSVAVQYLSEKGDVNSTTILM